MASDKRTYNTIKGNVGQVFTGNPVGVEQVNHYYAADPADPLGRALKALTDAIEKADELRDRAAVRATVAEVSEGLRPPGDRRRAVELLRGLLTRTAEVATVSAAVTAVLQLLQT